jgi:phenylpropionate dioxygenase-like ring-hydroxylating dioxygenase large terminal subunit
MIENHMAKQANADDDIGVPDCSNDTEPRDSALQHYWHAVSWSRDITDRPLAVRLLDHRLVLWRSANGIAAFHDLCIHRGTPLSLGSVANGEIVCAYHGWRYGSDGMCTHIPSLAPERGIPAKARAVVYHVAEKYGLVWVSLKTPSAAIPEFPQEVHDASYRWDVYSSDGQWKANAARMIENLLDFSHFPWVHPGILGDASNAACEPSEITPIPGGFQYEIIQPVNRLKADSASIQRFTVILPLTLLIERRQPDGPEKQTNIYICTPLSDKETRFFRLSGRNYRDSLSDEELNKKHQTIFEQDRVIVESQRPEELPLDLAEELHLRGPDSAGLQYRKALRDMGVRWR